MKSFFLSFFLALSFLIAPVALSEMHFSENMGASTPSLHETSEVDPILRSRRADRLAPTPRRITFAETSRLPRVAFASTGIVDRFKHYRSSPCGLGFLLLL